MRSGSPPLAGSITAQRCSSSSAAFEGAPLTMSCARCSEPHEPARNATASLAAELVSPLQTPATVCTGAVHVALTTLGSHRPPSEIGDSVSENAVVTEAIH